VNYLNRLGLVNFDMSLQKEFPVKERVAVAVPRRRVQRLQPLSLRAITSTCVQHLSEFGGGNYGLPTLAGNALGRNPNGTFNVNGFDTSMQPASGTFGSSHIMQLVVRVQF
jgi:hypothetical protein